MRKFNIFQYRFVSATFWMFVATGFLNVGNYFYHLIMGRMLGPSLYGVLESMISLIYLLSIPLMTLTLVIIKFVSSYKGKNDFSAIGGLYSFFTRKAFLYGSLVSVLIIVLSPLIVNFLHLQSNLLVILLAIIFFISIFNMLAKAILQGLTDFLGLAVSNLFEVLGKLGLSIILVLVGIKVVGAFAGFVAGILLGFLVAYSFIKKIVLQHGSFNEKKELLSFSLPVFFSNLALTSIYTTDILLVRHFFPGNESGLYAALSILGKIIFFAASPLTLVMFPLVSEHHAAKKKYIQFLILAIIFTSIITLVLTLLYFFLPQLIIGLLYGSEYSAIVPMLGYFAIFISIYTICFLLTNFYLSVHKTSIIAFVVAASILQIILIWLFHSTLFEVIKVSIIAVFLLLIALMVYYPYVKYRT